MILKIEIVVRIVRKGPHINAVADYFGGHSRAGQVRVLPCLNYSVVYILQVLVK
jgi:hypothetical protein